MLCKCGCGEQPKPGNKYINGHNRRGVNGTHYKEHSWQYCECGCGQMAPIDCKWIRGHNSRSEATKNQLRQLALLKKRGTIPEEAKKNLSEKAKQQWADPEGRTKKLNGLRSASKTEESKAKRRAAQKRKWKDPEMREIMTTRMKGAKKPGFEPWIKGRNHTPETLKKLSELAQGREAWNKGQICPQLSGANNGSWAGGVKNAPYCFCWDVITKAIREKYDYECQNPFCEGKGNIIVTHHIDYNKQNCDGTNLIALCNSCNTKANKNREWHKVLYTEIRRTKDENRLNNRR
jgi:hypothetical protein